MHTNNNPADITVQLNGEPVQVASHSFTDLMRQSGIDPGQQGIAVALNNQILPRALWPETQLHDGDIIEVITAMQGG